MKILAIEASAAVAGAAILEDGRLIGEYETNFKKTHSQTLLPMVDALVRMTETDKASIDAVAITAGPGSFTGLRIGAATAKGIAMALNIPIIAVSTLDSLAYNLYGIDALVCPIMDARRQQVYTGVYQVPGIHATADASTGAAAELLTSVKEPTACAFADLVDWLDELGRKVIFLGDGVPVYRNTIAEQLHVPYAFAPAHLSMQRAATTASLAYAIYTVHRETCLISPDDFRPEYLRKSQAEREMEQAQREGAMDELLAGTFVKRERARVASQQAATAGANPDGANA